MGVGGGGCEEGKGERYMYMREKVCVCGCVWGGEREGEGRVCRAKGVGGWV